MRNVVSVILFIIAGFFFYIVGLLSFISEPAVNAKWGIMFGFALPAAIALCLGLALRKFHRWKRNAGIVFISATGLTTFIVVTFICMLMTEEYRTMMGPETVAYFRDYITGGAVLAVMAILGIVLLCMGFDRKNYWEKVYGKKKPEEVSWYQIEPKISLELIASADISRTAKIVDVGGGASVLVDKLLNHGFKDVTVIDVSAKALAHAKERLGSRAESVKWIEADITELEPSQKYELWHDRAVFHFLTDAEDRKKYVQNMDRSLNAGGHVIIASFSMEGPRKCSGLKVERYSPEKMKDEFGSSFELIKSIDEIHVTPSNSEQMFTYFLFKKR